MLEAKISKDKSSQLRGVQWLVFLSIMNPRDVGCIQSTGRQDVFLVSKIYNADVNLESAKNINC